VKWQPHYLVLSLLLCAGIVSACNADEKQPQAGLPPITATATPAGQSTTTTAIPATASRTATPAAPPASPAATATPARTATAVPPRVDGTVDPLGFGSTEPVTIKSNPDPAPGLATLRDIRIGVHAEEGGWERIVFEFTSHLPAGSVAYADRAVACGSGAPVSVPGNAILLVRFDATAAHDDAGRLTIPGTTLDGPGKTVLQARQICDFEGVVTWALGVSGTQRFKVTRLSNPTRVVIDIKQ
jgi:hypothetical protein